MKHFFVVLTALILGCASPQAQNDLAQAQRTISVASQVVSIVAAAETNPDRKAQLERTRALLDASNAIVDVLKAPATQPAK